MQRQPKCAETWTSPTSTLSTAADSKSWTGFPCGMEPNWPSTPSWSPRAADHDGAALEVARRQKAHVPQNLLGKGVGHGWFWQFEVGRSNEESATFLAALANARAGSSPSILQGKVETELIRRWSAMLACSAALAFEQRLCSTAVQCQARGSHPVCARGLAGCTICLVCLLGCPNVFVCQFGSKCPTLMISFVCTDFFNILRLNKKRKVGIAS